MEYHKPIISSIFSSIQHTQRMEYVVVSDKILLYSKSVKHIRSLFSANPMLAFEGFQAESNEIENVFIVLTHAAKKSIFVSNCAIK